jgi:glycosyltransferase involved in cell wall biosynthesis
MKQRLFCMSHLRWDFVFQRPQHLLTRAAREYEVIYLEEPELCRSEQPDLALKQVMPGLTVATPLLPQGTTGRSAIAMQRRLVNALLQDTPPAELVLWYYTPLALAFSRHLKSRVSVYDNMDQLSAFRGAPRRIVPLEHELFRCVDVIFTGGQSLYEAKRDLHTNIHPFPSSIDAAHFGRARQRHVEPADQASIPRPRAGFFGVIDERMDMPLVEHIALKNPDCHFVFLGPVAKIDPSTLPRFPNLHWLGPKQYTDLPSYLAGWDVGLMPFALNEATRFISPTKTPEYLAAGVPVVSTAIQDVVRPYGQAGLVEIANSAEDFSRLILAARSRRQSVDWIAAVDAYLGNMSWDATWNSMHEQVLRAARFRKDRTRTRVVHPPIELTPRPDGAI